MLSITWGFAKERGLFEIEIGRSCGRSEPTRDLAFDHDEREVGVSYHTRFGCIALTYFAQEITSAEQRLVDAIQTTLNRIPVTRIQATTHKASDFSGIPNPIVSMFDQDERRN